MPERKQYRVKPLEECEPIYKMYLEAGEFDFTKEFKRANPELCETAHIPNQEFYNPYNSRYWTNFYTKYEGMMAFGLPQTYFLQAGIFYLCSLYTAREQGLITKTQFLFNCFQSHWFDWITCLKRFGVFGIGGGLLIGSIMFGDPNLVLAKVYERYNRLTYTDPTSGFWQGNVYDDFTAK